MYKIIFYIFKYVIIEIIKMYNEMKERYERVNV